MMGIGFSVFLALSATAWADPSPDFNGDGALNVYDVIAVVYCVVGIECPDATVELTDVEDGDLVTWNEAAQQWEMVTRAEIAADMGVDALDEDMASVTEDVTLLQEQMDIVWWGTACPENWWGFKGGRMCMENTLRGPGPMSGSSGALATCAAQGGHVCTHADSIIACAWGYDPTGGVASGWYGDHGTAVGGNWDDEYGVWNTNCNGDFNTDGVPSPASASFYYRCCY
jgi:hypothetical protein